AGRRVPHRGELRAQRFDPVPKSHEDVGTRRRLYERADAEPRIPGALALQLEDRDVEEPRGKVGPDALGYVVGTEREPAVVAKAWGARRALRQQRLARELPGGRLDLLEPVGALAAAQLGHHAAV